MAAPRLGEFAVLHVPPPHTHTYAPTAGAPIARCLLDYSMGTPPFLPAPSFHVLLARGNGLADPAIVVPQGREWGGSLRGPVGIDMSPE